MAYSDVDDLLTGDIPLPSYLNSQKAVDDAADEMDTYIGFRYVTPVALDDTAVNRPAILLLKRINSHLSSGRLLMEAAASSESTELHAYAKRLVDESLSALVAIRDGDIILGDAEVLPETSAQQSGPLQYNKDSESMVDAIYDNVIFTSPDYYSSYVSPD